MLASRVGFDDGERCDLDALWSRAQRDESKTVSGVRNDIEHGGFRKQPVNGKSLKKRVKDLVKSLNGSEYAPAADMRACGARVEEFVVKRNGSGG